MSRRDTIIIAVLVNAGLLLVLFATAMRSNKKEESKEMAEVATKVEATADINKPTDELLNPLEIKNDPKNDPLAASLNESTDALAFADEMDIPLTQTTIEQAPVQPVPVAAPAPAPTPAPTVEKKSDGTPTIVTVTVKKGDALEKIARAHHSSVNAIMKANNLTSSNLKIGQVLKVPTNETSTVAKKESAQTAPKKVAAAVTTATGEGEYYTVKEGDNPWLIATRNHVKLDELLKLNGMDETKARKLKPGDRLRIR